MKKIFLFAAIAATLGFVSCNKNQPVERVEPVDEVKQNTGMLFVNLAPVNGNETKANKTTLEGMQSTIRSIQVFVFSAESNPSLGLVADQIETSKFIYGSDISNTTSGVTKGNAIAFTTYLGKKKIIALVNAPRQEGVTTVTELLGRVSNLSENYIAETSVGTPAIDRQGMVMAGAYGYEYVVDPVSGGNGINITPDILNVEKKYDQKDDSSIYGITIPVYRLGARIEVGTVTVNFNDTDMRGTTLTIKDIKLKNVMTTVTFGGGLTSNLINEPANWDMKLATTGSNAGTYRSGVADKLQDTDLSIQCKEGEAAPVNKSFIVYPNESEDPAGLQTVSSGSAANVWSPRRTRLVIHAQLTGGGRTTPEDTFYSFSIADPANIKKDQADDGTFSQIVGNRRYVIDNINITMKGKPNDDDDMLPATGRVSATIEVKDWSGETLLSYEM